VLSANVPTHAMSIVATAKQILFIFLPKGVFYGISGAKVQKYCKTTAPKR